MKKEDLVWSRNVRFKGWRIVQLEERMNAIEENRNLRKIAICELRLRRWWKSWFANCNWRRRKLLRIVITVGNEVRVGRIEELGMRLGLGREKRIVALWYHIRESERDWERETWISFRKEDLYFPLWNLLQFSLYTRLVACAVSYSTN